MLLYLDNCCYNRPYDDQSQLKINLETQAKLYIQKLIIDNRLQLASSFMLLSENDANPHENRRRFIRTFIESYTHTFVSIERLERIKEMAIPIMRTGIKCADAYHLACAILAHSDYFLTTDKRILKFVTDKMIIQNPMLFLSEIEE